MKNIFLIGLLLLFISCDKAQQPIGQGEGIPDDAVVIPHEGTEGMAKARVYEGSVLIAEGEAFEGLKHGAWVTFDANGLITSITTYHKGVKQGASLEMDNQGYLSVYANYSNDGLSGLYKVYNRRRLIEERNYVRGKLDGELRKFYQDGTLMEESNYANGSLDGIAKWYDTEGNLSIAYEYRNGELVDEEAQVE